LYLSFEAVSGLKINLAKSVLVPVGDVDNMDELTDIMGIEKLHCDFLWGGLGEEFKYHLVSWSTVCSLISEGGLGIKNLRIFNQSFVREVVVAFCA
jgi:hypothetical protein